MEFSSFAQMLYQFVLSNEKVPTYCRQLFYEIVTDSPRLDESKPKGSINPAVDAISKLSSSSFQMYYQGENTINRISVRIRDYLDLERFANFVVPQNPKIQIRMVEEFAEFIPDITTENLGISLATLFQEIIINASNQAGKRKRKKRTDPTDKNGPTAESPEDLESQLVDLAMVEPKTGAEAVHFYASMLKDASESAMSICRPADTLNRIKSGKPVQSQDLKNFVHDLVGGINLCVKMGSDVNSDVVLSPKESAITQLHRVQEMLNSTSEIFKEYLAEEDDKN